MFAADVREHEDHEVNVAGDPDGTAAFSRKGWMYYPGDPGKNSILRLMLTILAIP